MTAAALIPTPGEFDSFTTAMRALGFHASPMTVGRVPALSYMDGRLIAAQGGLGKVNFAVTTIHLIERHQPIQAVICLGTCGALTPDLAVGDIVAATETVEHDFNRKLTEGPIPRFESHPALLEAVESAANGLPRGISVKYGPIASGDEGIDTSARARRLIDRTGGIVAAWEGAGGAKACDFARVPYIEIRCVSDLADENAMTDYRENTPIAMSNLAALTTAMLARAPLFPNIPPE